jgi:hypothetical protein
MHDDNFVLFLGAVSVAMELAVRQWVGTFLTQHMGFPSVNNRVWFWSLLGIA